MGQIEILLNDETVSEVMVNGLKDVWVERKGMLEKTDVQFEDETHPRAPDHRAHRRPPRKAH